MKISLHKVFILTALCLCAQVHAQNLHKICPVILNKGSVSDSVSFVLTTADFNMFRGGKPAYAPAIEIIDGDAPWPPRWFAFHDGDTSAEIKSSLLMLNASVQNDRFMFYTIIPAPQYQSYLGMLICNRNMDITDSFFSPGRMINPHEFTSSTDGSMMFFADHDTVLDLRRAYHNDQDVAIKTIYETIEIADSRGKPLFSWNPMTHLGFDACHLPYRYAPGVMSGQSKFEWSHGNSLQYDYDGNILYSFKHIGIGKISRTDGHIIWRIDRNKQKSNAASDAIPIYLQHHLQAMKDAQGNISYTVLSNGDSLHPECRAYRFKVDLEHGEQIVKLLETYTPSEKMAETGGGGNFDEEQNGNYLFNYGLFKQDSALTARALFEYRDEKNKMTTEYSIASPMVFSYRVHRMGGWRPARPLVSLTNGILRTNTKSESSWYKLSGSGLRTIKKVGEGDKYTPKENGDYCVVSKSGIGWAVSKPFHFTK
jgi:hypothetical protein